MKTIIIGGVAGGATCAARLRRLNEQMAITIYEKTGFISYANCGLPYYIGEVITDKRELTLQTPSSFKQRFNVDVFVKHEVLKIDRQQKLVVVKNLVTGEEFNDHYDKLVMATGAKAIRPNILGSDLAFCVKTVEDTYAITDYINEHNVKRAVVVGGGFIGVEMVENLVHRGLEVTLVERLEQVINPLDYEMASFLHNELRHKQVNLLLGKELVGLVKEDSDIIVKLKDGEFKTQLVIFALGVRPESDLALNCGLELGLKNSIKVNEYLETSDKDIYACGDVIGIPHWLTKQESLISLAGPANKQARLVADNICGWKRAYLGALGSSIIKVFNLNAAFTGLNEKQLKAEQINYSKIYLSPNNHASYYPGSEALTMKILFELPTYKLLGAEIVGGAGVDKALDVLALAISKNISLLDLNTIDFVYAPPFSNAKNPINMASFIADNLATGQLKQCFIEDLGNLASGAYLLDVRTPKEYALGHVKGFTNIPLDTLRSNTANLPKDKPIYVMCQSALRSYIACAILQGLGYKAYNIAGGYRLYASVYFDALASKKTLPCGMERC